MGSLCSTSPAQSAPPQLHLPNSDILPDPSTLPWIPQWSWRSLTSVITSVIILHILYRVFAMPVSTCLGSGHSECLPSSHPQHRGAQRTFIDPLAPAPLQKVQQPQASARHGQVSSKAVETGGHAPSSSPSQPHFIPRVPRRSSLRIWRANGLQGGQEIYQGARAALTAEQR